MTTIMIQISWRWVVDYQIYGYVLMDIFSVMGTLVHLHRGDEIMYIGVSEDELWAPEWCSLTSLGPPHPITHK